MDFTKISYLPVDLPRFTHQDEILRGFDENFFNHSWAQDRLTPTFRTDGHPYDRERKWLPEAQERFPNLIEYIKAHLPFRGICIAKILRSEQNIGSHVDIGKFDRVGREFYLHQCDHAPCAYRIVLNGEYDRVLYYSLRDRADPSEWVYSRLPETTNVFVHSSTDSVHGTVYDPSVKRYVLFIHGWLDLKRHYEILARSYQKYQEYAITFELLRKAATCS